MFSKKVVYIGSVAQCGDRMPPLHWGEAGEPVYASKYDQYSVSKCIAERIIVDSGIKWWVSLRQTGILYPGIFRQLSPTAFHVPLKGVLEWATVEDCGYDTVYTTASAKNRFISAVLSAQSRG